MTFPPLVAVSGFPAGVAQPAVIQVLREGSVWKLWATPTSTATGAEYATSADGMSWVISAQPPTMPFPRTILWNPNTSRYEGLTIQGSGFGRMWRP
jgi:hypothetical protein